MAMMLDRSHLMAKPGVETTQPVVDPTAPAAGATYTPAQFQQWYQSKHGAAIDPNLLQQIGSAVGPAGAGGAYSQAQWEQAQGMASGPPGTNGNTAGFFPEFNPTPYEAGPAYTAPTPFQAPTMADAEANPGYQFALQQGSQAIMGNAAAAGLAKSGGTLKNLMAYGQQMGQQNYGQVYDRAAGQYAQNYNMGRDAWMMNDQQRQGAYDRNYKGQSDAFNAQFAGRQMSFEDIYKRWALKSQIEAQMALAD